MRACNIKISECNHQNSHPVFKGEKKYDNHIAICEDCGGYQLDLTWQGICRDCGVVTDELYALFVPHLCKDCYTQAREQEIKEGRICRLCHQPWIDCCC